MGNYRFRLSDMMPNAWFYKLKDMGTKSRTASIPKKQPPPPPQPPHKSFTYPRKSHYFTRALTHSSPHPPRKSSSKHRKFKKTTNPKLLTSSVSADCSCRATLWTNRSSDSPPDYSASSSSYSSIDTDDSFPLEFRSDRVLAATESFDKMVAWSTSCGCNKRVDDSNNDDDIIINVDNKSLAAATNFDKLELSDLELPPIITKPPKFDDKAVHFKNQETTTTKYKKSSAKFKETDAHGSLSVKLVKEESVTMKHRNPIKKHANSPGLRFRVNSPRIGNRRIQGRKSLSSCSSSSSRRSLSDSLAIVKSSCDPQRDFRESMVEMIVENNIRASKDLEDLLACYLSLNSDEYHDLIIKVFKQIWFDLTRSPSK